MTFAEQPYQCLVRTNAVNISNFAELIKVGLYFLQDVTIVWDPSCGSGSVYIRTYQVKL